MEPRIALVNGRPTLKAAGIRKTTLDRLRKWVYAQYPRPVIADVVSQAVDHWLDHKEGRKAGGAA